MVPTADVLNNISEARVVQLLERLVSFPTVNPPGDEEMIARFIAEILEKIGCRVQLQYVSEHRPNVIALFGEGDKRLVFNTHMDVVPVSAWNHGDPFNPVIKDGKVYGRGTADAKGSLAAMIAALEAISTVSVSLPGEIAITAVVDEEGASRGAKDLFRDFRGNFGIVGEPTGLTPVIAHRGTLRLVITTKGKSAHSSMPEKGVNAIYQMIPVIQAIEDLHARLSGRRHRLCGSPTVTVTKIVGGEKENIVPNQCEIIVDRRLIPGETMESALDEIRVVIEECKKHYNIDVRIKGLIETTGGPAEIEETADIARIACQAVHEVTGWKPKVGGLFGTCDMVHLVSAGIPTVVLGPGDITLAHTADEHIDIRELHQAAKVYALIIMSTLM